MRALVTGSSGFIGSAFTRHLRESGWSVLEVDVRHDPPIDCRKFFHISRQHFDLVIHAAAVIPHLAAREQNAMPVAGNLEIDAAFFQWLMKTRPTKTVYFSSAAAYPIDLNHPRRPLHEDDIDLDDLRQPDGMYGYYKLTGEIQAREAKRQGLHVLVVRPQTGYGEQQTLDYPLPAMVHRALHREDPFIIWGSGNQVRDPIYVDDIVAAVMTMLDMEFQGPVNLGSGDPWTLRDMASLVCAAAGYTPTFEFLTDKPEGSRARYADTLLMEKFYHPNVTLEEGIRRMLGEVVTA
jgi:nucleoside-diphosphate-sugar epimerase